MTNEESGDEGVLVERWRSEVVNALISGIDNRIDNTDTVLSNRQPIRKVPAVFILDI